MLVKNEVGSCRIRIDDGKECIYKYFVIETSKEIFINGKNVNIPCYGICIESEVYEEGMLSSTFENTIEYATPFLSKILKLIDYLKQNEVSPVHLIDVAGEFIDEWVNDFDIKAYYVTGDICIAI